MRIDRSFAYDHDEPCSLQDCQRHYCKKHRFLWRDCDTARKGYDDPPHYVWEMGDCPLCEVDAVRERRAQ